VEESFESLSAQSITVLNGDIYVSGNIRLTRDKALAIVWKNGEIHQRLVELREVDGPAIFAR